MLVVLAVMALVVVAAIVAVQAAAVPDDCRHTVALSRHLSTDPRCATSMYLRFRGGS